MILLNRRRTLLQKTNKILLPSEYQQVEYIESTGEQGKQYIDTGVGIDAIGKVFIDAIWDTKDAEWWKLDGVGDIPFFYIGYCNSHIAYGNGKDINTKVLGIITDRKSYEYNYTGGTIVVDGITISNFEPVNITSTKSWIICACRSSYDPISYYHAERIYHYSIYDKNGDILRNFIPCYRKLDNVIGLYDVVNGVFYTNYGKGTFLKGGDV